MEDGMQCTHNPKTQTYTHTHIKHTIYLPKKLTTTAPRGESKKH